MWNTSEGPRILQGAEALPVREAIGWMVDLIHEEASGYGFQVHTSVELYDNLTWTQRLALLDEVTSALLLPSFEIANPGAAHDAAVGAIFNTVMDQIGAEVDLSEQCFWRKSVHRAYRSCFGTERDGDDVLPSRLGDTRLDRWEFVVELLCDRVLHDHDYEMANTFLDLDPEKAAVLRELLGIQHSYYARAGEEISDAAAASAIQRIRHLAAGRPES